MPIKRLINNLNTGLVSPLLDARVDAEKHGAGCRQLENFFVKVHGGAFRRPGFTYLGKAKLTSKPARILPFNFSATTNFVIEVGHEYMRFWSNGIQVLTGGGAVLEIASPYREEDLDQVQFVQINDVVFLAHPLYEPRRLARVADNNWTLEIVPWSFPALGDENLTDTTLEASATTGSGVDLVASVDLFEAGHVGSYFQLAHRRDDAFIKVAMGAASTVTSSSLRIVGTWEIFTYGVWTGTIHIERQAADGTWEVLRSFDGNANRNVQTSGTQDSEGTFRLRWVGTATGSQNPYAYLEAADSRILGLVKITAVTDAQNAVCDVVNDLNSTDPVTTWSESAWSTKNGFPRAVALHEQRLVFGGCTTQPQTLWGSQIGDFLNFQRTSRDDGSFAYQIAAQEGNAIQWLATQGDGLIIGTQGDEWLMGSGTSEDPITPTNVRAKRQTRLGSEAVQAQLVNEVVIFVQRGGRKLREYVFAFETSGYISADLTLLAEHVTAGQIKQIAFSQHPDPTVWAIMGDGRLGCMSYDRGQNVVAWAEMVTDGEFESVASIYGEGGDADEIWVVVKREIDGATCRTVERLARGWWDALYAGSQSALNYLDCSKAVSLSPASTIVTGLDHLEGETVGVSVDGAVHPDRKVIGGQITLQTAASEVVAGLRYTSTIQPTRTEIPMENGTAQGRKFRVAKALVNLWQSGGAEFQDGAGGRWSRLPLRDTADAMDAAVPLFTGETEVQIEGQHRRALDITIRTSDPAPLNILALVPTFEVYGS